MLIGANPLLVLSIVLVVGAMGGALAKRLHLPSVTGQILLGVLLGPSVLHLIDEATLRHLSPLTHFALGLMAVAVGNHLHLRKLRNAKKRLTLLLLFEATLTPALVFGALVAAPKSSWQLAMLLAALSVSTAPATILALVKETRAKGVFVKTLVAAVALNNIACICLFEVARTAARASMNPGAGQTLLDAMIAPFRQLGASALVGGGIGLALVIATRRVVRSDRLTTASIIAILLTAGLASHLGVSTPLACLFLGVVLANLTPDKDEIGHGVFANFEGAIFAVFFTLAGMELHFGYIIPAGVLAILMFGSRIAGKLLSARFAMRLAGATQSMRSYLGPALVPQAGLAVGLILLVTDDPSFVSVRDMLLAVGLTVVTLNEIVGPLLTRSALARSGDAGKDRARVIDFLHEENIVTGLSASSKEEAIEKLVDVLIQSNHLRIDRERLLDSVLERERSMSTCFGEGFAIPHGELEEGTTMLGAMGISKEGLLFETPDGQPVHCMFLLATPAMARDRHLEVLAALARSVGSDHTVRQQLYSAKSPAHAYELLHAHEGSVDFNYFLEDDLGD